MSFQKCPICSEWTDEKQKITYCKTCNNSRIISSLTGLPPDFPVISPSVYSKADLDLIQPIAMSAPTKPCWSMDDENS
jgi:hypothetical protein